MTNAVHLTIHNPRSERARLYYDVSAGRQWDLNPHPAIDPGKSIIVDSPSKTPYEIASDTLTCEAVFIARDGDTQVTIH